MSKTEKIINFIETNGAEIIEVYSNALITSSVCCLIASVIIIYFALWFFKKDYEQNYEQNISGIIAREFSLVVILVTIMCICWFITDLLHPKAAAISKLITEISGKK